jgi:hypothetical protein
MDFNAIAARCAELARANSKPDDKPSVPVPAKIIQLPLWRAPDRAAPSSILRSALFSVARRRRYINDEEIASWKNSTIRYKGESLDQCDEDVWLQLIHLHRLQNLADSQGVRFKSHSFLKLLGRNTGGSAIHRLYNSLLRMIACAVIIETPEARYSGPLIVEAAEWRGPDGFYCLKLNPQLVKLFDTGWTRFEFETRRQLKTDVARWLHAYVCTQRATIEAPHRIGVERLHALCGSDEKTLRNFRQKIKKAMAQLEAASVVLRWHITDGDALEFSRPLKALPSPQ